MLLKLSMPQKRNGPAYDAADIEANINKLKNVNMFDFSIVFDFKSRLNVLRKTFLRSFGKSIFPFNEHEDDACVGSKEIIKVCKHLLN